MAHYFYNRAKRDLSGGAENINLPSLADAVKSFQSNGDMILPTRAFGAFDSERALAPDELRAPREYDMDKFEAAVLERQIASEIRKPKVDEEKPSDDVKPLDNPEGAQ